MSKYQIKILNNDEYVTEALDIFCSRLSKRNISVLFLLENYLNKSLLSDSDLAEIRRVVLSVSGEIERIPNRMILGDVDERL